MTTSYDSELIRKIKKSNVNKAIKLIMKKEMEKKKHLIIKEVTRDHKIALYCKTFQGKKRKRTSIVGFSKSLALSEMQSYIARQDWRHAFNLFPTLLEYPIEIEPLIWRYAFIILLHTNDSSHLRQFFEQCIGSRNLNNDSLLKRLLLLPCVE